MKTPPRTAIVLPARYASTRFPAKMLVDESGWPLIRHTFEQARKSQKASRVIIATDDERIFKAATDFGAEVMMTDVAHPTGTDRIAEVARNLKDIDLIVNVQGDEPEIEPDKIDTLIDLFAAADAAMATLVCPFPHDKLEGTGSPYDPNCNKTVLGAPVKSKETDAILGYEALYFSRSLIPYPRDNGGQIIDPSSYYLHLGIYAYTPAFLQTYVSLPQGKLEVVEKLEQLRVLENGYKIVAGVVPRATPGIDTRADYDAFLKRWKETACYE